MLIGIDVNPATRKHRTGTENYVYCLIEAMKKLPLEPDEQIFLYSHHPLVGELGVMPQGWRSVVLHAPFKRYWTQIRLSWEMLRRPPDLLFVPAHALPWMHPHSKRHARSSITTIHDLGFRRLQNAYHPRARRYLHWSTTYAASHARVILVPSEFTKRELVELYAVPEDRIVVTPLAGAMQKTTAVSVASVLQKYQLSSKYFLTVCRMEEKKNIVNLLRAFEAFKARRGVGDPFELVLVGSPGFGYERIKKFLGVRGVRELGWVDEAELSPLMQGAFACIYPSWYEGFGLAAVEPLSLGVPLIASAIPALQEVAGDAALYFPPNEPERLAEILREFVDEPIRRDAMVAIGHSRAVQFSWELTAQRTLEALRAATIPDGILKISRDRV